MKTSTLARKYPAKADTLLNLTHRVKYPSMIISLISTLLQNPRSTIDVRIGPMQQALATQVKAAGHVNLAIQCDVYWRLFQWQSSQPSA